MVFAKLSCNPSKFTAMRLFHFLAFHKGPFTFIERFFFEKFVLDDIQRELRPTG